MSQLPPDGPLFRVPEHLRGRYVAALKAARGLECPETEIWVDRLGWSPQIARRHGRDYLAHESVRYAIILSPDQAMAPVLHRRFSYEPALIEQVYQQARATILDLVEHEAVIVTMQANVPLCRTAYDAFGINRVTVSIDTAQQTVQKNQALRGHIETFVAGQRIMDNRLIAQMVDLAKVVGDPRSRPLPPLLALEPQSFWVQNIGVVYVLRAPDLLPIVIASRDDEQLRKTAVQVLSLSGLDVLPTLHRTGFLAYRNLPQTIERRMRQLEIDALLDADEPDPADDDGVRRRQLAANVRAQQALQPVYHELDRLRKQIAGDPQRADPEQLTLEARWALSSPVRDINVMGNLISRFVRYDYRMQVHQHRLALEAGWPRFTPAKRRYFEARFAYLIQGFVNTP